MLPVVTWRAKSVDDQRIRTVIRLPRAEYEALHSLALREQRAAWMVAADSISAYARAKAPATPQTPSQGLAADVLREPPPDPAPTWPACGIGVRADGTVTFRS